MENPNKWPSLSLTTTTGNLYDDTEFAMKKWKVRRILDVVAEIIMTYCVKTAVERPSEDEHCHGLICVGKNVKLGRGSWKIVHCDHLCSKTGDIQFNAQFHSETESESGYV